VGSSEQDFPPGWEEGLGPELAAIVERGYAHEAGEFESGTAAIAAPIVDRAGNPIAALSISGPSVRFDSHARKAAAPLLIEVANDVAAELDGRSQRDLAENRSRTG
jgi:DNA-binding IclR family transcriptional regulator